MASSLFRISIVARFPPADEYVVVDGRDASCMMPNNIMSLSTISQRVSEFIDPPRIHRKMVDENVYFPSVGYGPKPCPISVCSFLDAHYENLALDIAVREYGFSCVVVVPS
jgi:hypothetical protein